MQNKTLIITLISATVITVIAAALIRHTTKDSSDNNDEPIVIVLPNNNQAEKQPESAESVGARATTSPDLPTSQPPQEETEPKAKSINFKINHVHRSISEQTFRRINQGDVLHSNDSYKIIFTPEEDSYIYIFQKDSANLIFQLFPMERFKNIQLNNTNPVQSGQTYYLPSKSQSFILDKQIGTETIYFLAAQQPDTALEKQFQQIQAAQRNGDAAKLQLAQTHFMEILQQKSPINLKDDSEKLTWTNQGQQFTVLQQRLDNLCQECVHILTFQHQ